LTWRYELQRRLDNDPKLSNLAITALDPGGMPGTGIQKTAPLQYRFFATILGYLIPILNYFAPSIPIRSPARSGRDLLYASMDVDTLKRPKAVNLNGPVIEDTSLESHDEEKQGSLWEGSLKLANLRDGDTILHNWK
jgi:WW domain-containing oxidoreductase